MSREISFRYELLRGGAYCAQLRAVSRTPRLRMNGADSRKFLLSGSFGPTARDADGQPVEIDWRADEIRPIMIIDGEEHPLGVFVPSKPEEDTDGPVTTVGVSAYDRTQKVFQTNSADRLYWAAGTPILDAVEGLLTAAGIETIFKTGSASVFSEARADWDAGTPYLDVVNRLLGEINYNSLWFDARGAAVLEPAVLPTAAEIRHTLDTNDPGTRVVAGRLSRTRDYYDAPNDFIVICQNPEKGAAMRAESVNENPQSPISVPRTGRRICSITYVNNIASQAELQAYADRLRDESLISGETLTIETGLLPGWGVGDTVALNYKGETSLCVSRAYDMELKVGGRMRHTLQKVVYALDV